RPVKRQLLRGLFQLLSRIRRDAFLFRGRSGRFRVLRTRGRGEPGGGEGRVILSGPAPGGVGQQARAAQPERRGQHATGGRFESGEKHGLDHSLCERDRAGGGGFGRPRCGKRRSGADRGSGQGRRRGGGGNGLREGRGRQGGGERDPAASQAGL